MSDSNVKFLRKQVRNVAQAELPGIVTNELILELEKRLSAKVEARLDKITEYIKSALNDIDNRAKETQAYLIRNTSIPAVAPTDTVEPPKASE